MLLESANAQKSLLDFLKKKIDDAEEESSGFPDFNESIDGNLVYVRYGAPVYSVSYGKVISVDVNSVNVEHRSTEAIEEKTEYFGTAVYGNLCKDYIRVKEGDEVSPGQLIGQCNNMSDEDPQGAFYFEFKDTSGNPSDPTLVLQGYEISL